MGSAVEFDMWTEEKKRGLLVQRTDPYLPVHVSCVHSKTQVYPTAEIGLEIEGQQIQVG